MVGNHHEEDDKEDPKVKLAHPKQGIATLIELVTLLLVMKSKEAHLAKTEHEEHKAILEGSKGEMLRNLGNDCNFSSYSSFPFKVEEKLGIHMYDEQTNAKVLDS
jgi:hypothetical protein